MTSPMMSHFRSSRLFWAFLFTTILPLVSCAKGVATSQGQELVEVTRDYLIDFDSPTWTRGKVCDGSGVYVSDSVTFTPFGSGFAASAAELNGEEIYVLWKTKNGSLECKRLGTDRISIPENAVIRFASGSPRSIQIKATMFEKLQSRSARFAEEAKKVSIQAGGKDRIVLSDKNLSVGGKSFCTLGRAPELVDIGFFPFDRTFHTTGPTQVAFLGPWEKLRVGEVEIFWKQGDQIHCGFLDENPVEIPADTDVYVGTYSWSAPMNVTIGIQGSPAQF